MAPSWEGFRSAALPKAQPTRASRSSPSEVPVPQERAVHSANASPLGLPMSALRFPPTVLSDHLTVHVGN